MEYTNLGSTGLKVSRLGFGGIPIQRITQEEATALIHKLPEYGVNYIDTARGYTVSEEYLGIAMEGIRDKFVLATKSMARTKEAMEKDIETSLKNLRTDHIDLYQVHNAPPAQMDIVTGEGGALEALLDVAESDDVTYIDFIEIRSAIERLGSEAPVRDFSNDPTYKAVKRLQLK